jgi:hypothetical protein
MIGGTGSITFWSIQPIVQLFRYWLLCYKVNLPAKQTSRIDSSSGSYMNKMRFTVGSGNRSTNTINRKPQSKLAMNTICYMVNSWTVLRSTCFITNAYTLRTWIYFPTGAVWSLQLSKYILHFLSVPLTPISCSWTYGIQLWGAASTSNIDILERFNRKPCVW